ncbi:FAD-binding oxidoreductase [Cryptosporangium japonicum]|uniref:FAD-binding oxidoreductase n=1 Tax=Cryptosporangium japonicum TaxID=80872 RepID=A0ABP3DH78_9ACTN
MFHIQNLRGRAWFPGESGFDDVRRPWNRAVDQPALAVVEAADADDVLDLVRFARHTGRGISAQANGHDATGRTDGAILLRTGRLDTVDIDPVARRARIGAGVASGRLQAAAAPHGLTGLPGSSPIVSVAGAALGGGLSWFARAHGWVADAVVGFDVVDADGLQRRVSADDDPELFWALRGGGGDFAVVTGLELTLYPAPTVYGGRVRWSGEHAAEVFAAFRDVTATAPDELTVWLDLLHFPGAEPMVALDTTYLGDAADVRGLFRELPTPLSDSRRVISVAELGSITAEPTEPTAGISHAELLTTLDDHTVEALLSEPIAPLLSVQVRHLGGAIAGPSDSPHGPLTEPYALYLFGPAARPGVAARATEIVVDLPISGRKPYTFLGRTETAAHAFAPDALTRLRGIKQRRDPANVFRSNFPVNQGSMAPRSERPPALDVRADGSPGGVILNQ